MTTTKREPVNLADMVRGEVIIVSDGTGTEVLRGVLVQTGLYDKPQLKVGDVDVTVHNGHYEREVQVPTVGERFRAAPVGTTFTLDREVRVRLSGDYYAFLPAGATHQAYPSIHTLRSDFPPLWEGEPEDKAAWSVPRRSLNQRW